MSDLSTPPNSTARRMPKKKHSGESDERYRSIFENSTVAMWEEDFSAVKVELDRLRADGVNDIGSYIREHPEFLERTLKLVKVLDANQAMLRLYNAKEKKDMLGTLDQFMGAMNFRDELLAFAEGQTIFEREIQDKTLQGQHRDLLLTVTYYEDMAGHSKALAHMIDITARKKAENDLLGQNEYLALINEMNRAILMSDDYDSITRVLAVNLKRIIAADDCYILRWNEETKTPIPATTTANLDFPFTGSAVSRRKSVLRRRSCGLVV